MIPKFDSTVGLKMLKDDYDKRLCGTCRQIVRAEPERLGLTIVITNGDETVAMVRTCSAACATAYIQRLDMACRYWQSLKD